MKIEKKNDEIMNQISENSEKLISRKEAIKKTGYVAASAATMMILLNKNAQAKPKTSGGQNNGWGNGDQTPPGNSGENNDAENAVPPKPNPLG